MEVEEELEAQTTRPPGEETEAIDLEDYDGDDQDQDQDATKPAASSSHPSKAGGDDAAANNDNPDDANDTLQKRKGDPELEAELRAKRPRQDGKEGENS